ncbi:MAG: ABC transporter substrate-binding protein [Agathobacter sp.]|nr:ABC transporter substrate-binding protein [Agathobacter sp.]
MKKKIVSALLVAAMAVTTFAGCGDNGGNGTTQAGGKADKTASGKVYMLNFKPETDEAWKALAETYTDQTGVEVNILTAADGQYNTTLQSEMSKSDMPTIFTVGNTTAAQTWNDYTYDLKDTDLYNHLTDKSLVINYDNKVAGVANCYECYGIIFNKTILEGYCGMDGAVVKSVDEINNFDTLKKVADDINSRVDEINEALGTDLTEAFASAGLDDGSSWRFSGHLANMPLYYEFKDDGCDLTAGEAEITGKYLDNFKNVWDMYVSDSAADPKTLNSGALNAESEFGMGEAVFYQNGDWEYANLTNPDNGYTVTAEDLSMMPIYFGVDDANEGLCVGTENYWAVNKKAPQEDIDATLEFLNWVITSDEGRDAITNQMGLTAPFDTFTGDYETKNAFAQASNKLMSDGKTSVAWSFNATPNVDDWRKDVVAPLTAYSAGTGSWDDVVTAFVDGWANQWKLAHEGEE